MLTFKMISAFVASGMLYGAIGLVIRRFRKRPQLANVPNESVDTLSRLREVLSLSASEATISAGDDVVQRVGCRILSRV